MALQNNNFMLLDFDGNPRTIDTANDTLAIGVDLDLAADLSVGGDLHVVGDIISGGATDVIVTDNFIDLNNGNLIDRAGGLTINVKGAQSQVLTAGAGTTFTASTGGSDAKFVTDGIDYSALGTPPVIGDIIEISGLVALASNNGLFVVTAVGNAAAGVSIAKAAGLTTRTPFCQTNFEVGTEDAGNVSWDLALTILAVSDGTLNAVAGTIAKGKFCTAYNLAATKDNLVYEAAESVDQQESYNAGAGYVLLDGVAGGSGDVVIKTDDTGARADWKLQTGAGNNFLSTSATGIALGHAGNTGEIAMTGQVSTDIVFDGAAPRNIQQTGQNIEMKTLTSGHIAIDSIEELFLKSKDTRFALIANTATADCSVEANFDHASTKTLLLKATNASAGQVGRVEVSSDGNIDLAATGEVLIDAAAATANSLVVQSSLGHAMLYGKLGTKVEADTNNLEMKGKVNASLTSTTGNTNIDSTAGFVNSTAQTGHRLVSTSGGFDVTATAGGFSIDSTAGASNVTANAANLTLSTTTSGDVVVTSAGKLTATGGTEVKINATAGVAELTAPGVGGATTVSALGKVTLASSTADLDIDAKTSIAMDSEGATVITAGTDLSLFTTLGHAELKATGAGKLAKVTSTNAGVAILGALAVDITATGGALTLDHNHVASSLTLDTAGTDGVQAMDLKATAGGIQVTANKNLKLTSATEVVTIASTVKGVDIGGATHSKFEVTGANQVLSIKSTDATGEVELQAGRAIGMDGFVEYIGIATAKGSGIKYKAAGNAVVVGEVLVLTDNAGTAEASAATNTNAAHMPVGIATTGANSGAVGVMHTVCGVTVPTDLGWVAGDTGKFVFLGATGALTKTAPTASGTVTWRMGTIVDKTAGAKSVILWNPQYVSKRP